MRYKFGRSTILVILIIALGTLLRFYNLEENLVFHGELGSNYLDIKNYLEAGKLPLLGPPTSHPWLSFGPLFYWLMAPILSLFNYDPIAGGYFFAFIGVATILVNYLFVKKIFDERVALLSSFLVAISPAFITLTHEARFFSLVVPLFYPFSYFLQKFSEGFKKYLFWVGLIFGVILNFHYSPLIFVPIILFILVKKREAINGLDILKLFLGFLIPTLPLLIYNVQNDFVMITQFMAWIPYRVLGFFRILPQNNATPGVVLSNIKAILDFIIYEFTTHKSSFVWFEAIIFLLSFLRLLRKKDSDGVAKSLVIILFFGFLALFIHGDPPSHYFYPLFPIPIILISIVTFNLLDRKPNLKPIAVIFVGLAAIVNIHHFLNDPWKGEFQNGLVKFEIQKEVTGKIIDDAGSKRFNLNRIGPNDNFDGDYAQNYQFLMWLYGNEPKTSNLTYTIVEPNKVDDSVKGSEIFEISGIKVYKHE